MSTAKTDMIIVKMISGSKAEAEAEALDYVLSLPLPLPLAIKKFYASAALTEISWLYCIIQPFPL